MDDVVEMLTDTCVHIQILLDKKYGRAVDWWAFGVLIYQMLLQQSPFRGEDEDEIYAAILAHEPNQQQNNKPTDAQEVMSQPFFRTIVWDDIYHKRGRPPGRPAGRSEAD